MSIGVLSMQSSTTSSPALAPSRGRSRSRVRLQQQSYYPPENQSSSRSHSSPKHNHVGSGSGVSSGYGGYSYSNGSGEPGYVTRYLEEMSSGDEDSAMRVGTGSSSSATEYNYWTTHSNRRRPSRPRPRPVASRTGKEVEVVIPSRSRQDLQPLSSTFRSLEAPVNHPTQSTQLTALPLPLRSTTNSRPRPRLLHAHTTPSILAPPASHLFPFDESELLAVRSMWIDQGRKGLGLVDGLVRPVKSGKSRGRSRGKERSRTVSRVRKMEDMRENIEEEADNEKMEEETCPPLEHDEENNHDEDKHRDESFSSISTATSASTLSTAPSALFESSHHDMSLTSASELGTSVETIKSPGSGSGAEVNGAERGRLASFTLSPPCPPPIMALSPSRSTTAIHIDPSFPTLPTPRTKTPASPTRATPHIPVPLDESPLHRFFKEYTEERVEARDLLEGVLGSAERRKRAASFSDSPPVNSNIRPRPRSHSSSMASSPLISSRTSWPSFPLLESKTFLARVGSFVEFVGKLQGSGGAYVISAHDQASRRRKSSDGGIGVGRRASYSGERAYSTKPVNEGYVPTRRAMYDHDRGDSRRLSPAPSPKPSPSARHGMTTSAHRLTRSEPEVGRSTRPRSSSFPTPILRLSTPSDNTAATPPTRLPVPESIAEDYYLLQLPLHPPPPPHTPLIPPLPTLPRSPYRPSTPPTHPTPRMRIVPNPAYLRIKAMQNRVLWGLVEVDRGEGEVLRRVGVPVQCNAFGGAFLGGGGGLHGRGNQSLKREKDERWEVIDRQGRMCSGKEARVGVAIEGRGKSGLMGNGMINATVENVAPAKRWWVWEVVSW